MMMMMMMITCVMTFTPEFIAMFDGAHNKALGAARSLIPQ